AGDWYLWPTQDPQLPCRAVRIADGVTHASSGMRYEPTQLRHLPAGNMAFGQGALVIATPTELLAFVGPNRLLPKLQAKAQDARAPPADRGRLALALGATRPKGDKETQQAIDTLLTVLSEDEVLAWKGLLTSRHSPTRTALPGPIV